MSESIDVQVNGKDTGNAFSDLNSCLVLVAGLGALHGRATGFMPIPFGGKLAVEATRFAECYGTKADAEGHLGIVIEWRQEQFCWRGYNEHDWHVATVWDYPDSPPNLTTGWGL